MARTTEEKAKRTRDGADDAVYKPARSAKKPVRTESEKTESGAKNKKAAPKEKSPSDKPAQRKAPRKYDPLPKEDTPQQRRQKREKEHIAAVAKDRQRAISRAGDAGVTLIALLTAVFELLGLLLCSFKTEGTVDMQAMKIALLVVPLGLMTTLALPRLLPIDALVMALTNFLCGVGIVVLYTVSPDRGARQAVFYAAGLAVMLVMSELVFHMRHFRGLTMLGMALGILALILPGLVSAYNCIIMKSFFLSIPESLEESARIDGATDLRIFFSIILPLSKATIATIALFTAVGYWNDYFSTVLYIRSVDKWALQAVLRNMLTNTQQAMQQAGVNVMAQTNTNAQTIKAGTIVVSTVPILIVYPFVQKYFVKGVMIGGVKG